MMRLFLINNVESQIISLNKDFSLTNPDHENTPTIFTNLKGNAEIQFCLAQKDPNGMLTNGITRTYTNTSTFTLNNNVKRTADGGKDAWNTSNYLNIWVCNLGTDLMGYGQQPGLSASTDGVVLHFRHFGTSGMSIPPFNLGRTATHEIGHWLNLLHIWGDDDNNGACATCCSGDDLVADTPNQGNRTRGCPTSPKTTCSSINMTMNYMDYTNDECMYMFTKDQVLRMRALLAPGGARNSLINSDGCIPGTPSTNCSIPGVGGYYNLSSNSTTVFWGNADGAVSYDVQLKNSLGGSIGSPTNVTTGFNFEYGSLDPLTTYSFSVRSVCSSGSSSYNSDVSFTTLATGESNYPISEGNSQDDEWIDLVELNSFSRTSASDGGYFYDPIPIISLASTCTLKVSCGFKSGYVGREFWNVWIDWNKDGDFMDSNEHVVTLRSASPDDILIPITIPIGTSSGETRLRISLKWNSTAQSTDKFADGFKFGEVEDYKVSIP